MNYGDSNRSVMPLIARDLTLRKGVLIGFESRTGHLCEMQ